MGRYSIMSSLYNVMLPSDSCKSDVINIIDERRGPSTEPCGTPDNTGRIPEDEQFTQTYCMHEQR